MTADLKLIRHKIRHYILRSTLDYPTVDLMTLCVGTICVRTEYAVKRRELFGGTRDSVRPPLP